MYCYRYAGDKNHDISVIAAESDIMRSICETARRQLARGMQSESYFHLLLSKLRYVAY